MDVQGGFCDAQDHSQAENPMGWGSPRQSQGYSASLVEDSRDQLRPKSAGQLSLDQPAGVRRWQGAPLCPDGSFPFSDGRLKAGRAPASLS